MVLGIIHVAKPDIFQQVSESLKLLKIGKRISGTFEVLEELALPGARIPQEWQRVRSSVDSMPSVPPW